MLYVAFQRKLKIVIQGALKWANLSGQKTEPERKVSQILADFCRYSPSLTKQSIWETRMFAEKPLQNKSRLAFSPLGSAPQARPSKWAMAASLRGSPLRMPISLAFGDSRDAARSGSGGGKQGRGNCPPIQKNRARP